MKTINVDKIESVTLQPMIVTDSYEIVPEHTITTGYLMFKKTMRVGVGVRCVWNPSIVTPITEFIANSNSLLIRGDKVFNKAIVVIVRGRDFHERIFDTTELAVKFYDEVSNSIKNKISYASDLV